MDITYEWFKNGVYGGNQNFYEYRNLFNPPPAVDSVRIRISNGYYATEKNWFVTVTLPTDVSDTPTELTYSLKQNFPNPFNPSTDIKFSIPQSEFVNLTVYNLIGQKVAVLINENKSAGNYSYRFDASALPAGVYVAKISAGTFNKTIKMIYLK
ncbi:MAG: T9SS type A sorting domain-containing protein [Ignavibacteriales bacterium]|nr:T9SS type A sorting domain-containing protein [Ignavibacteriales bacterium]